MKITEHKQIRTVEKHLPEFAKLYCQLKRELGACGVRIDVRVILYADATEDSKPPYWNVDVEKHGQAVTILRDHLSSFDVLFGQVNEELHEYGVFVGGDVGLGDLGRFLFDPHGDARSIRGRKTLPTGCDEANRIRMAPTVVRSWDLRRHDPC